MALALGYAWMKGFPAIPSSPHPRIAKAIGGTDARTYVYSRGGFIDWEYLWRIDAEPTVIEEVIQALELRKSVTIPAQFWKMPPYYWPRSLSPEMKAFRSLNFSDDTRGADGAHFFLLHDPEKKRAYVWFRDNF
ncbi:hypothetical protein FEM03_16775 [Phragmitibacter flavus]|uniref:Uncharacterized protein n=1 Tax=Phragmitibacter flavus TaxID=2576071 RepID=A0A5R8KBD7_9BACT|nr:hypothetical protein [Phragmitibacter flavus]TLD69611.1 hypothetical protein FEM03_16775 [Phragmitibacter flavus]